MIRSRLVRRWALACLVSPAAGFSTAETTVVIAATSVLSATASPQIQQYLETARDIKARGDARVIALSIARLSFDIGRIGGGQRTPPTLLVSDGEVPPVDDADAQPWTAPLDDRETQALAAHLVDNRAGYDTDAGLPLRWRGPYIQGLSPDPWGARYAVNVGFFDGTQGRAVIVLSPGPNGLIETPFETVGLQETGDDVIALVGSGR